VHDVDYYEARPADIRRWLEQLRHNNLAVSTVYGRLAAVAWYYERAGRPSPVDRTIRRAVTGYARLRGTGTRQARALMLDDLRRIIADNEVSAAQTGRSVGATLSSLGVKVRGN